jgi:signal transduction histidine kinase/DNA-binding response OmpR family regulator
MDSVSAQPAAGSPPAERLATLSRDLAEAAEQQMATSQVLEVIGRSAFELQPVFETVLRHAVRLCGADAGQIYQAEGELYRLACVVGGSEEYQEFAMRNPIGRGTGTLVGRVGLERQSVQIPDVLADPDYNWQGWELGKFRTLLGVPMLFDDQVLGVIALCRTNVDPFGDRTIDLVTTFAAQGAIAIQNVHLFQQVGRRERDMAQSVEELRALGEISQAVSSSFDLDEVLTKILSHAIHLSGTDGGSIFEFDAETREFELRICHGTSSDVVRALRKIRIHLDETFVGAAATHGRARQAPDLERAAADPHFNELLKGGWRSLVAVPLLREDEILGMLTVRRRKPGRVSDHILGLLETVASQSAVAIHNARVFKELQTKTAELEVASRHKSEFLASMSHELRTPLNAVIGFSEVLLERMFGDLNAKQEEYVRDIHNSGRHLLELINEILDLSKIEAGRMEIDPAPVSLPDILEYGLSMVRERAAREGVSLELDCAADLGTIWADELKLKQVVLNLLTNAVKFTPTGGSVFVSARIVGDDAHVMVRDTGIGVPEQEQERIFEAFQRGGRGARSSTEGTGLGLTLSKRILELHGGRIWMTSRLRAGSTFAFAIPVHAPSEQPVARPLEPPAGETAEPARASTILIIEDDRHSSDLLRVYLEGAGFDVTVAHDGVEGLALARQVRPRGILLDIRLPRLDGWDLLTQLKADAATASIPVVIVSMLDERGKGFALGASEYLIKPVGRHDVLEALGRCLQAAGNRRKVVAIDDDPVDLDLVEAVLAPQGYSVLRATGGEEGIELVRREQPAVVLLDLLMPGVDGFDVVDRLRADADTADIPIVVLTSKSMTADDRARLAGQISYLAQKGQFGPNELIELVRRLGAVPTSPEKEAV